MSREHLRFMLEAFEAKVNQLEEDYKKSHREDFNKNNMKRYVNNKLKRELKLLAFYNIAPSMVAIKNSERFKY